MNIIKEGLYAWHKIAPDFSESSFQLSCSGLRDKVVHQTQTYGYHCILGSEHLSFMGKTVLLFSFESDCSKFPRSNFLTLITNTAP